MGDACKILCQVIAVLFFKQVAAFSAHYTTEEESRGHCIHTEAVPRSRDRDSSA